MSVYDFRNKTFQSVHGYCFSVAVFLVRMSLVTKQCRRSANLATHACGNIVLYNVLLLVSTPQFTAIQIYAMVNILKHE
jgi:hypothetical protein